MLDINLWTEPPLTCIGIFFFIYAQISGNKLQMQNKYNHRLTLSIKQHTLQHNNYIVHNLCKY